MTNTEALKFVRREIGNYISISPVDYDDLPEFMYQKEKLLDTHIFSYRIDLMVGSGNYIAVSKKTGKIVSVFKAGE